MKRILSIFIGLAAIGTMQAQTISTQFVDSIAAEAMKRMPHAGMAIAVIENGKVVHSKGYGLASVNEGRKVDENSLFCIASNSKAFTTTCLGMLVDQGKLSWDTKVVDIIPEFKMYDSYVTNEFTIIDLLTHRSGLGLGAGDLMLVPDGSDFGIEDVLKSFVHQDVVSSFRTKYDYDNLLYLVAGEVIYRITGEQWDKHVEKNIMGPLGMDRTRGLYQNIPATEKNIANPHKVEDGKVIEFGPYIKSNGGFGAAGGIYSSVNDLSKWVMMHLNEGVYGDSTVLISHKNHDELWKAQTNMYFDATPQGVYKTHYRAYGLGFQLYDQNNYTIVQHSGGLPGMLSMVTMVPELKSAVVVLTNCDPGGLSFVSMTNEIKDELIGVEGPDWIARIETYLDNSGHHADSVIAAVWDQVDKNKKCKIDANDYVGEYEDAWFGKISVELIDGKLWFRSHRSPKLTGQMYYFDGNSFAIKWNYRDMDCDAFAIFSLNEHGVAQSIRMKGISPKIDFSYDFHDLDLQRVK